MKDIFRNIRLKFGKFLLDKNISDNYNRQIKSILFLRQDGKIGDYIVSSFVFREIKNFNPQIKIGVVCTDQNAYLFAQNKNIDKLYLVKKKNIIDYIKCGLKIRKESYDVVIDPTLMLRNRDLVLLRLIRAKNYLGYDKSLYKLFNLNILDKNVHFSSVYKLMLEKLDIPVKSIQYDVPFRQKEEDEIIHFLQTNQIENYIVINFYGAAKTRKFLDKSISNLLVYLTKIVPSQKIVLLSYPEVVKHLQELSKNFPNIFVHDTKNIFHTIALIRHSIQVISPDTSIIHIASGLNKPIIGFYSEDRENFTHWQPIAEKDVHILFYKNNINEIKPENILRNWLL